MKIKEYIFCNSNIATDLEYKVNLHINLGYHPFGSIALSYKDKAYAYAQAMVKYEEESIVQPEAKYKYMLDIDDYNKFRKEWESCKEPSKITYVPSKRKLIDFSVSWHSTIDYMERNEKDLLSDGWETFKKESVDHATGLMSHKLMMVKYENNS